MRREKNFDNACGVLILYMILLHCSIHFGFDDTSFMSFFRHVFFFFMPWFFFKNGYFFKLSERKVLAKNSFNRLIKPYLKWMLIGHLIYCIFLCVSGFFDWKLYVIYPLKQLVCDSALVGNLPLWFLLSLFLVRLLANELLQFRFNLIVVILLLGIICYISYIFSPLRFILLSNVPTGLFFFLSGYIIKNNSNIISEKSSIVQHIMTTCPIIIYLSIVCLEPSYVDMRVNILWEGLYVYWLIGSILACLTINTICRMRIFDRLGLGYIGRNSMMFYVSHWVIFYIIHICIAILTNMGFDVPIKSFV